MTTRQWIGRLLDQGLIPAQLVHRLLDEDGQAKFTLGEASVHLPPRGKVWVAYHTGPEPGQQVSRSTGLTDHAQALARAKEWQRQAQAQRAAQGRRKPKPTLRVRQPAANSVSGPLTQREVAARLGMSVRAVRNAEQHALAKLAKNPLLRQAWAQFLAGELHEG